MVCDCCGRSCAPDEVAYSVRHEDGSLGYVCIDCNDWDDDLEDIDIDKELLECELKTKASLREEKDYKFKAKVGDFWLQKDGEGWRLCDDKDEADEFESDTEPKQIINQMQKNGEIEESSKIEIVKIKESKLVFEKIIKEI